MLFPILNVYMPCTSQEKQLCWNSLLNLPYIDRNLKLIVAGDFNTSLNNKEKKNWDPNRELMEYFMSTLDLIDINPSKGKFTWSNKRHGPSHIVARLDHFC
jgi:endonuclease/exonuclease/phosphatase family metal-dependent hydrolase